MRSDGRVPAVVYGGSDESLSITLDSKEFEHALHRLVGEHALVNLKVGDSDTPQTVLIQSVQHDPLRDDPIHVDFLRVRMDEKIATTVHVTLVGTCQGVKMQGGILDQALRDIEIECLPEDLPEEITVDVTDLMIGDSLNVDDVTLPAGVVSLIPGDRVVAHVLAPRIVEEAEGAPEEVEEGAEAEPERIGEDEAEEEGGEEAR